MLRYIIIFIFFNYSLSQKSYEGAQLLRLYDINNSDIDHLVENFGGNIWKDSSNSSSIDISFENNVLENIKGFIEDLGINYDILISNIAELINHKSSNTTTRTTTTTLDWNNYYDYTTIINFLYSMQTKYPTTATLLTLGTTFENRQLLVLKITNNDANNAIWIDGGIHAREWISPASVTYIINYLLTNWNTTLPANLKNKTWYIMPLMNPDGYSYAWTNDRLWRKNRKPISTSTCVGVDLNRNWNIDWNGSTQSSHPCSDTFKGTAAFSEKETKAVSTFLTNNKALIKGMLTYHSYSQYILWPWGYTYSGTAPNAAQMQTVAQTAQKNIKALTGKTYSAVIDTALGIIAGVSGDWSKSALNIPFTYTVELRDTGAFGFVLPASQIIGTAKEALEVVKAVANAT